MKAFLSYPSERLDAARQIYDFLGAIGVVPWFDKTNPIGGQDWDRERAAAQRAADVMFLVYSAETQSRAGVVQREIREGLELAKDKPLDHTYIIPLRTHDIQPSTELARYHFIDFFRSGWPLDLAISVRNRLDQLSEVHPPELTNFFAAYEAGGGELKSFRRGFAGFDAQADYLSYRVGGEYWEYVTADIKANILGGYYKAHGYAQRAANRPAGNFAHDIGMSWSRRVVEDFRNEELVSLRIDAWEFYGGAHGTRGTYTKNYGGPTLGRIEVHDLFGWNPQVLAFLLEYSKRELTRRGDERGTGIQQYAKWELFSQWTFNRDGIQFYFGMFSGLPYVFGEFEVRIPWALLHDKLYEDIRDTAFGTFILQN